MPNPKISDFVSHEVILPPQTLTTGTHEGLVASWGAYGGLSFVFVWGSGAASVGASASITLGFVGGPSLYGPLTEIPTTDLALVPPLIDDPAKAVPYEVAYLGALPFVRPVVELGDDAQADLTILACYFNPSRGAPRPVGFGLEV